MQTESRAPAALAQTQNGPKKMLHAARCPFHLVYNHNQGKNTFDRGGTAAWLPSNATSGQLDALKANEVGVQCAAITCFTLGDFKRKVSEVTGHPEANKFRFTVNTRKLDSAVANETPLAATGIVGGVANKMVLLCTQLLNAAL
jgi:hypothetical protein